MDYIKTNRQQGISTRYWILEAIKAYIIQHGYPPTVREICDMTGIASTSTVSHQIKKMLKDGTLESDADMSPRAIRVPGMRIVFEEIET